MMTSRIGGGYRNGGAGRSLTDNGYIIHVMTET
jgi:hypothetical protein